MDYLTGFDFNSPTDQAVAFGWNLDAGLVAQAVPTDSPYLNPGYFTDWREAAKLDPFVPKANESDARPWWERVAEYGLTRAIDSHFGMPAADKTSAPGTFAGANGRTYTNAPGGGAQAAGGVHPLLLILAAGAALLFV